MTLTKITGNTYPVKDQLRALGGRWNAADKCWEVPSDKADAAQKLVTNAPPAAKKELTSSDIIAIAVRKRGGRPGVCSMCGGKCKYPYDECWDCKEEREMGY